MRKKLPNLSYDSIRATVKGLLQGVLLDDCASRMECEPDHLRQVLLQRGVGVSVIAGYREVQADLGGFDAAFEKLMARYTAPPSATVVKIPAITLKGDQADLFIALKRDIEPGEILSNDEVVKRLLNGAYNDLPTAADAPQPLPQQIHAADLEGDGDGHN